MAKEYLKMADVFHGGERQYDLAGIGGVIDSNGEQILQTTENDYCLDMLQGDRSEYLDKVAKYAAHAINSHDELVAEVERLREMVCRMGMYLEMSGEYPEKESDNLVRQWLYDSIQVMASGIDD